MNYTYKGKNIRGNQTLSRFARLLIDEVLPSNVSMSGCQLRRHLLTTEVKRNEQQKIKKEYHQLD